MCARDVCANPYKLYLQWETTWFCVVNVAFARRIKFHAYLFIRRSYLYSCFRFLKKLGSIRNFGIGFAFVYLFRRAITINNSFGNIRNSINDALDKDKGLFYFWIIHSDIFTRVECFQCAISQRNFSIRIFPLKFSIKRFPQNFLYRMTSFNIRKHIIYYIHKH